MKLTVGRCGVSTDPTVTKPNLYPIPNSNSVEAFTVMQKLRIANSKYILLLNCVSIMSISRNSAASVCPAKWSEGLAFCR